jgi:hypothetical protein
MVLKRFGVSFTVLKAIRRFVHGTESDWAFRSTVLKAIGRFVQWY